MRNGVLHLVPLVLVLLIAGCETQRPIGEAKSERSPLPAHAGARGGEAGRPADAPPLEEPPELRTPTSVIDDRGVIYGTRIDESTLRATLHVKSGTHAGAPQDGSEDRPFGSLPAAARAAVLNLEAGIATRVLIHAGTYRESFGTFDFSRGGAFKTLLVIEGAEKGKVIISGADAYPGNTWRDEGGGVWSHEWKHDLGITNVPWNKMTNVLGARSEMAWINGRPLTPRILEEYEVSGFWTVETNEAERGKTEIRYVAFHDPREVLEPGTFGIAESDDNGNRVYVRPYDGVDITTATIELAVRPTLLTLTSKENLVLRNLTFEKAANRQAWHGCVVDFGPSWEAREYRNLMMERCDFLWNSETGFEPNRVTNITVRECSFNYNGFGGAGIGDLHNVLWEDNESSFNDWRNYMAGSLFENHNTGGVKWHESSDVLVRRHRSLGNFMNGLWFDVHCRNVTVEDSMIAYNARLGLFFELGQGPYIARRCVLANNDWAQFMCSVTGVVRAEQNIMYASRLGGWSVHQHVRGNEHAAKARIEIGTSFALKDNVVVCGPNAWQGAGLACFTNAIRDDEDAFERVMRGYRAEDNLYFHAPGEFFKVEIERADEKTTYDLARWLARWNEQETGARFADPKFVDPARGDFRLQPGSPIADREAQLPIMKLDAEKIDEIKAFFSWATTNTHVEPMQTLPQFLEFVRGL